jgi:nucleoside-diphosphate-sugar epimerase
LPKKLAFYKIGSGEQRLSLVSVNNVVDVIAESIDNKSFFNETFNVRDFEDYSINQIILFFKEMCSQKYKPVITIPQALPLTVFQYFKFLMPQRAEYLKYQFNKIANDNIYSGSKLLLTGIQLKWNLGNTLKSSFEC